jgi:hypothetical protein
VRVREEAVKIRRPAAARVSTAARGPHARVEEHRAAQRADLQRLEQRRPLRHPARARVTVEDDEVQLAPGGRADERAPSALRRAPGGRVIAQPREPRVLGVGVERLRAVFEEARDDRERVRAGADDDDVV